jgi:hypothetical protein
MATFLDVINSSARIPNVIMGFLDDDKDVIGKDLSHYQRVRAVICQVFSCSPYFFSGIPNSRNFALHTVVYTSPLIDKMSDAAFILMGERHENSKCNAQNRTLVCATIEPSSALFVESAQKPENAQEMPFGNKTKAFWLKKNEMISPSNSSLDLYGWDAHESPTIKMKKQLDKVETIKAVMQNGDGKAKAAAQVNMKAALTETQALMTSAYKEQADETRLQAAPSEHHAFLSERFPARTQAMVQTLQIAVSMKTDKKLHGMVFFLAGNHHFHQTLKDPRFSLASLYKMLRTIPAIVVYPTYLDSK